MWRGRAKAGEKRDAKETPATLLLLCDGALSALLLQDARDKASAAAGRGGEQGRIPVACPLEASARSSSSAAAAQQTDGEQSRLQPQPVLPPAGVRTRSGLSLVRCPCCC